MSVYFFFFTTLPTDIDECLYENDDCDVEERANCSNTVGSFSCICKDGFMGDGKTCTGETGF